MATKEVKLDQKNLKLGLALMNEIDATLHQVGALEDRKLMLLKRVSELRGEVNKQREFLAQRFVDENTVKVDVDIRGAKAVITSKDEPQENENVTDIKKKKGKKKK